MKSSEENLQVVNKRSGIFETNSSSSHSISLAKGGDTPLKSTLYINGNNEIHIMADEFGWGEDIHNDAETKLSYLVTWIFYRVDYEQITKLCDEGSNAEGYVGLLSGEIAFFWDKLKNIIKEFTGATLHLDTSEGNYAVLGSIDHQSYDVAADLLKGSDKEIIEFIFNPASTLVIDHDNHM